jgi:dynein heavy chain
MPALNEALKALDQINKSDISEIKTFPSPPALVRYTLETVCILLNEKPDWDNIKRILSQTNFIDRLKGFDKDNIPKPILVKVR